MDFEQNYQQCLEKLSWATQQLKIEIPPTQLSKIATLIVQTMTGCWRYFHSTEHIFLVGGSTDAIEVLAALFHDIVYVQIDGSIHFNLTYYLAPFIEEDREQLFIRPAKELPDDSVFQIISALFSFTPEQKLSPFGGQNEFLSAVVAAKVLEPFFPLKALVEVAACIEATIPFRAPSESGLSTSERLYQRLQSINQQYPLDLSDADILKAVKRAVRVANRDVGSFAYRSSAVFLANTWSLLPETNHNLRKSGSYTIRDYRIALQKMSGFLNFLDPKVIFRQFRGEPDDATYLCLVEQATKNLKVARLYLESKLFTNAILESLSLRIGSDVSLSILMGELPASRISVGQLQDSFPTLLNPYTPKDELEKEVLSLLEIGREGNLDYDLKTSPLTTFIVRVSGFDEIRRTRELVQDFFKDTSLSETFLASCNSEIIATIINGIDKLLENRKIALGIPRSQ
ncbi:hypothetical protein IQ249_18455 [Lusitaniella coriacea LEGE 07157]|uniref:Uncharacterized protein n=1 Tax=Lusitaniella coriacea LEGE 07157 TaxID=945747 RepID=A0A8J7IWA3_9CYAN|nr:hypothetical protein [Lusitaniella coriacea]MBE9117883.1 hypothetical protein [Lusitaniella coriacea LEGE 07157]